MSDDDFENRALGRVEFDREAGFTRDDARALVEGMQSRTTSALALYRLARASDALETVRLVTYRCAERGCLLLDVYDTPAGPASYVPPVKYSRGNNERSTDATARSKRTSDDEQRRWVEHADLVLPEPLEYWVSCDHLLNAKIPAERVRAEMRGSRGRVVVVPR